MSRFMVFVPLPLGLENEANHWEWTEIEHLTIKVQRMSNLIVKYWIPFERPLRFIDFCDSRYELLFSVLTACISGMFMPAGVKMTHAIAWFIFKQNWGFFSTFCEWIIAAAAADHGPVGANRLSMNDHSNVPLVLTVDSVELCTTISILYEWISYRLRLCPITILDAFESEEINGFQLIKMFRWHPRCFDETQPQNAQAT